MTLIDRRSFLGRAAGAAAVGSLASTLPLAREARAPKTQLTGVIWGGPWLAGAKAVTEKQSTYDIKWELLQGGSATIIPKIKAAWPNPPYDFVVQFSPLYHLWEREGWAEPVTAAEMPNIANLVPDTFYRDTKGANITVPLSVSGTFWGYRKDICPFPITKMDDLLDPRLKGKVIVRDATQGLNNNVLSYALAFGGNEKNMDPGWEFLKKLARTGNIARIGKTESDFTNAISSGECVVGFWTLPAWNTIVKTFPCEFLIKDRKEAPGFQVFSSTEAFLILKTSPRKEEVKDFLNYFISAESNEAYNKAIGCAPTNVKSAPGDMAKNISFPRQEDRDRFQYNIDFDYLSTQMDEMIRRFEKDVVPLLR